MTPAAGQPADRAAGDGEVEPARLRSVPSPSTTVRDRVIEAWTGTCPRCGGLLVYVTGSRPSDFRGTAIVRCVSCNREFVVQITVSSAPELRKTRRRHPAGCGCRPCQIGRQRD